MARCRFSTLWHILLLLVTIMLRATLAMKQHWSFVDEDREEFRIERFGFDPGASLAVQVADVHFDFDDDNQQDKAIHAGLLFVHEDALWDLMAFLQDVAEADGHRVNEQHQCLLQNRSDDAWIDFTKPDTWNISTVIDGEAHQPGFYYLFYAKCTPGLRISFNMKAEFKNGEFNYLSAGDSSLPFVYLLMSLVFAGATIVWVHWLRSNAAHVHHVHHMMTVLVLFKTFSLFSESMRYYYMKKHGDMMTNWNTVYYVFMFLKGIMLFVVILLVGTGWSLLKPHLSNRDKSIISIVLILQVLSNTAVVVMEESSVGTRTWVAWRDVLHVMDILCCFAILVPIVWSIRTLRQSATTDGKAHINLQKLTQFRSFYLLVVTYIYVTRIALFLLTASLPYNTTWVAVVASEGASAVFFGIAGYRFRPVDQHPYLQASTHIESLDEFGLDDDDAVIQMPVRRTDHQRMMIV